MAQFWRTKGFKSLSKSWDQKLLDSGFEDIEIEIKDDRKLRQTTSSCYRNTDQLERETRLDYYIIMSHLAHNTEFPSDLEKIVMIRHSDGAFVVQIVKELKELGINKDKQAIRYIIRRWETKWGIKTWSLKEMNLRRSLVIE